MVFEWTHKCMIETTLCGPFQLISTGGFPRCQKPRMRYFQHEVSFFVRERLKTRRLIVNSAVVSSLLLVITDIDKQPHSHRHVYAPWDTHAVVSFTALLCVFVWHRRDNKFPCQPTWVIDENGSDTFTYRPIACQLNVKIPVKNCLQRLWCDWQLAYFGTRKWSCGMLTLKIPPGCKVGHKGKFPAYQHSSIWMGQVVVFTFKIRTVSAEWVAIAHCSVNRQIVNMVCRLRSFFRASLKLWLD